MILRLLEKRIVEKLKKNKILLILGARQVGKTTLLDSIKNKFFDKKKYYISTAILKKT